MCACACAHVRTRVHTRPRMALYTKCVMVRHASWSDVEKIMLADDLIAANDLRMLGSGFDEFVQDLREAHRFELDADFATAADVLGTSRPSTFERALSLCRLPYKLTWFETANAHRRRFSGPCGPSQAPIRRIGCLFSSGANQTGWIAHLAWSFHDGRTNLCPVAVGFDFSGRLTFANLWDQLDRDRQQAGMRAVKDPWAENANEVDATIRFTKRTMPMPSMYHLSGVGRRDPQALVEVGKVLMRNGMADWESETPFWLGTLALLNSRNVSEAIPGQDFSKLNRARRSRGQLELLSYSTCRIPPKLKKRLDGDRASASAVAGVRAHFVRGHFKIRASGVFWWSPFLRGDKRLGFADKDYRVTGEGVT